MLPNHLLYRTSVLIPIVCALGCSSSDAAKTTPSAAEPSDHLAAPETPTDSGGSEALVDAGSDAPWETGYPDWQACAAPGDCVLAYADCCFTPENYAINRTYQAAWYAKVCPNPSQASCDGGGVLWGDLFAACVEGRCRVIVLSQDPISACSANEDCTVINGCGRGPCFFSGFGIRADQLTAYASQACPGSDAAAIGCYLGDAGGDSGQVSPVCGSDGHCKSQLYP
jgi:hypothetical protein